MKKNEMIPLEEQKEYTLLVNTCTNYKALNNWEPGIKLRRISIWYSGNGCGVRQAYFIPSDSLNSRTDTVWEDHVQEDSGQLEFDF